MRSKGCLFMCLIMVLSLTLLLPASDSYAEKPITLKTHGFVSKTLQLGQDFHQRPADRIELITGGRVKSKIYWAQSLVGHKEVVQALNSGLLDYSITFNATNPGSFLLMGFVELPGLMPNQATANKAVNAIVESPKYRELIKKQFKERGLVHISSQVHMRSDIHSHVPIRSLADLKGKVLAVQNQGVATALRKLGASVSIIAPSEWYPALERKTVHGAAVAWGWVSVNKLYEVANYHTLISICPLVSHWVFSEKAWSKLTADEQKKVKALARTFQDDIVIGNVGSSIDVRFKHAIKEKGHELIQLSPEDMKKMRETFRPMWDEWAEEMEKKGLPGKEILKDAIKFVDAYLYG